MKRIDARQISKGFQLDGFHFEEQLHVGGMAVLWRVSRPGEDMPMLMKIPMIAPGDAASAMVGFEVEQMILPLLEGSHVPRYIAAGDFDVLPYIVMEQIAGDSLIKRFDAAPIPIDEVVSIGIAVAEALADLHHQHVVHLDIKPSNIIRRPDGSAVLIDFGLSRHDHLPDLLAEECKLPMGTGPYISPEQVMGVRTDARSDLFATGVMLYALATGVRPFGNPQGGGALRKRLWQIPVPPRKLRPDMPPWLQEVILHLLEVSPKNRYQTAALLAYDLRNPGQIVLTDRSERLSKPGFFACLKRRFTAVGMEPPEPEAVAETLDEAPILMIAVDVSPDMREIAEAVGVMVKRMIQLESHARLSVCNVIKTQRLGVDYMEDDEGRSLYVRRLVELKSWATQLGLPAERVSYHVLQGPDPAHVLIEYANSNRVDHIVMGARTSSAVRRYLGSVSAHVVAEANCNVTVVRTRAARTSTTPAITEPDASSTDGEKET